MLGVLLLVDDDEAVTESLAPLLERSGYTVVVAHDGSAALEQIPIRKPDMVILDVLMPRLDGRAALRAMRAAGHEMPVIMLTEVSHPMDRVKALDEGADDYLSKPFDPHELEARIRALLRRRESGSGRLASAQRLRSGDVVLDSVSGLVTRAGRPVPLGPKATALLKFLMMHPEEPLHRARLLEAVWGWADETDSRAVDTRIFELRRALGDNARTPELIVTVTGTGYRFAAPVTPEAR